MGITLKAARINTGYSQEEAAKILGISASSLSNYERGKSYPDVPVIKKIEDLYRISYDQIIFLPNNYGKTVKHA